MWIRILKSLLHWLNPNKISLYVTKTEVVIFRAKGKVFDTDLKLEMCGKKLSHHVKYLGVYLEMCGKKLSHHVKYLGVYLDEYLTGQLMLITFVRNFLKLIPCSVKFVILLMKLSSDFGQLGSNPLSHIIEFLFYREMLHG